MLRHTLIALTAIATAVPALAAPKTQGEFSDWTVYTRDDGGERICYVLTEAQSKAPGNVTHGDVYFMVASWKSGAASEQPSLLTGYPLKSSSPPKARVGSTRIAMYTSDNEAFVEANADERKLVQQMRKGSSMRIDAVSQRGTATSYEFSLKGITAALRKAKQLCG